MSQADDRREAAMAAMERAAIYLMDNITEDTTYREQVDVVVEGLRLAGWRVTEDSVTEAVCAFCKKSTGEPTVTMRRKTVRLDGVLVTGRTDPAFNVEFCQQCYGRWSQLKELAEFESSTFVGTNTFGGNR